MPAPMPTFAPRAQGHLLLTAVALTSIALAGCLGAPAPLDPGSQPAGTVSGLAEVPDILPPDDATVTKLQDELAMLLAWEGTIATPEAPLVARPGLPVPVPSLPVVGNPLASPPAPSWSRTFEVPAGVTTLGVAMRWTDEAETLGVNLGGRGTSQCRGVAPPQEDAPPTVRQCKAWTVGPREETVNFTVTVTAGMGDGVADEEPFHVEVRLSVAPFVLHGPALAPAEADPALSFWNRPVDPGRRSAEPSVKVDGQGVVWLAAPTGAMGTLWRSLDEGRSFMPIDIEANGGATGFAWDAIGRGGGDAEVFVTPDGREVYFADLWGTCMTVAGSQDAGATWNVNPFSCELPGTDRQWLAAAPGGHVWMTMNANTIGGAVDSLGASPWTLTVFHSIDGGKTWLGKASVPEDACFRGNIAVHQGNVYVGGCNGDGPGVAVSHDGGMSFDWVTVAPRSGEPLDGFCYTCALFTVVDVDQAGNVYVAWTDPSEGDSFDIWLARSQDQGRTWSEPARVNRAQGTAILPWVAAGEEGHVAVVWMQSAVAGKPSELEAEWYVHLAETTDALAAEPVFAEALVDPAPMQYGPICITGSACAGQRNLLDFIMVDVGPEGEAHVAYTDGTQGGSYRLSVVKYARQTGDHAMGADGAGEPAQATL